VEAGEGGAVTEADRARDGAPLRFRWANPHTALVVGLVALLLLVACIPLAVLSKADISTVLSVVLVMPFAVLGFVLARREPRNPIGWILLFFGPVFLVSSVAGMYADLAYRVDGHDLPLSRLAVVLAPAWVVLQMVVPLPILLFPDGRIANRRWKWTLWAFLATAMLYGGTALVVRGSVIFRQHPVRIDLAEQSTLDETAHGVVAVIEQVVLVSYLALILSWVLRLILVYRSSVGDLRQQLKWLMVGGALCVVGIAAGSSPARSAAIFLGVLAFPVCIGIAILKYRLYDLDRLISRTLSYLIVTGLLIGVYIGLVALSTRALPLSSPVGVAASTLAVAALFNPVRRRAQRLVDRRFNRARYDADATVTAFTAALRNEIDLDLVQRDLVDVVIRSVQPAHVAVWIRSTS
jgi:hypothetical protein